MLRAEQQLLVSRGHHVSEYLRHNDEIVGYSLQRKATLIPRTVWAWDSYRGLRELLQHEKPDVAHFHNTFPLISPAAYYACRKADVPVVQTLHNYRLFCPSATLYRQGHLCEECLGKTLPWPGVQHACYRGSYAASATVAAMVTFHNLAATWAEKVDVFVALTEFSRRKFIEGGLPAEKIVVKPNFVHPDPIACSGDVPIVSSSTAAAAPDAQLPSTFSRREGGRRPGEGALFVGRLAPEKGLHTLLAAWKRLNCNVPLRIVGDGPLRAELEAWANGSKLVSFLGHLHRKEVLGALKGAGFLVFPSQWYEGFPLTIAEAFACGVPVIASRLGSMAEIVENGRTGLHFNPGEPEDLAAKVEWAWTHPREIEEMGRAARAEHEAKYTAECNYKMLMAIYERAVLTRGAA